MKFVLSEKYYLDNYFASYVATCENDPLPSRFYIKKEKKKNMIKKQN